MKSEWFRRKEGEKETVVFVPTTPGSEFKRATSRPYRKQRWRSQWWKSPEPVWRGKCRLSIVKCGGMSSLEGENKDSLFHVHSVEEHWGNVQVRHFDWDIWWRCHEEAVHWSSDHPTHPRSNYLSELSKLSKDAISNYCSKYVIVLIADKISLQKNNKIYLNVLIIRLKKKCVQSNRVQFFIFYQ